MSRRYGLILAVTLAIVPPLQAGDSWVGEKVMARKLQKEIKFGDRGPDGRQFYFEMAATVYRVVRDEQGWLRLHAPGQEGWVDKADMVLLRDAPAFYTTLIRQKPNNMWALNQRGIAWMKKGELDNAIKDYGEIIRRHPAEGVPYINRGNAWQAKMDYDKAIADYNEAIRLDPKNVHSYSGRGNTWRAKKNYDKAIADYNEAIRLDPKDVFSYANRGKVWHLKKEYAKALADYDEALRLDSKQDFTLARKAYLLAVCPDDNIRDGNKAVELARQACELTNWKNGWYIGVLGAAHAELGQFEEAIRWEQKGLEDPEYAANSHCPDEPAHARERLKAYAQKEPCRE